MPLVNMRDMLGHAYRNYPEQVAFADNLFRPVAGDRISIDYVQN